MMGGYDDWFVCTECGAVAYHFRSRLCWNGTLMSDDIKERAARFNARVAEVAAVIRYAEAQGFFHV